MSRVPIPDLKGLMDKEVEIKLNANRTVIGTLRGFDAFMNLVLDGARERYSSTNGNIATQPIGMVVIRGDSISSMQV
jgi:small nuclear ribonucleoprotein G